VISSTRDYAEKSAKYQFDMLGRRKAVAIYDSSNKSYTEDWLNNFKTVFEKRGGSLVKKSSFQSGSDIAFFDSVKEMLESDPDLFLIVTNAVDGALICQQVRKLNQKIPIAMAEWASTERFTELGGSATEGVHVAQFLDRNDASDQYQNFKDAYHERFGQEPGFAGIAGYDTGLVVIEALSRQKEKETLKETIIRKKSFQCLQQVITINRFGDADRNTFITIIKDGQYITLE
jgi:branched-chain amino acid transport system substrate-binding protein